MIVFVRFHQTVIEETCRTRASQQIVDVMIRPGRKAGVRVVDCCARRVEF